jgi:hypothetical protein
MSSLGFAMGWFIWIWICRSFALVDVTTPKFWKIEINGFF